MASVHALNGPDVGDVGKLHRFKAILAPHSGKGSPVVGGPAEFAVEELRDVFKRLNGGEMFGSDGHFYPTSIQQTSSSLKSSGIWLR